MNIFKQFKVAIVHITISFTFGDQNVHLKPAHKHYDRTACYTQSSPDLFHPFPENSVITLP